MYVTFIRTFIVSRVEDNHQCASALVQAVSRGYDADYILPDGFRTVRPPGLHGGTSQQVRPTDTDAQCLTPAVDGVSCEILREL